MEISGKIDVNLQLLEPSAAFQQGITFQRVSVDKVFHGELSATSHGEMLTVRTAVSNSAGYVTIEQVTGTLDGKSGSFVLQQLGSINNGTGTVLLDIVPDSTTGEFVGLTGKMQFRIEDGQQYYDFHYTFNDAPSVTP